MAIVALVICTTACSDLLNSNKPDAVVSIPVDKTRSIEEVRKEVKDETARLGGVRVGEDTTDKDRVVLEFMLPGTNLDAAMAALERLDPETVSTEVDVDERKLTEGTAAPQADETGSSKDSTDGRVRLRVDISRQAGSSVAVTLLGALMLLFSIVGLVSSARWLLAKLGPRNRSAPGRRVGRPDLDRDPPTQETPLVPPSY